MTTPATPGPLTAEDCIAIAAILEGDADEFESIAPSDKIRLTTLAARLRAHAEGMTRTKAEIEVALEGVVLSAEEGHDITLSLQRNPGALGLRRCWEAYRALLAYVNRRWE